MRGGPFHWRRSGRAYGTRLAGQHHRHLNRKPMKQLLLPLVALALAGSVLPGRSQIEYVDPTIGGVSLLLVPTRPTVHLPNSMVRVYPMRQDQLDDQIRSFPLTIISHRLGELFSIMPALKCGRRPRGIRKSPRPIIIRCAFRMSMVRAEFTPAERCGYFRFHFPIQPGLRGAGQPVAGELGGARGWDCERRGKFQGHEGLRLWRVRRAGAG